MILLLKKERFPVEDTIKKYSSEEALEIIKNFVKEECQKTKESFERHVGPQLDNSYDLSGDAYANYLVGKNASLTSILTKIRLVAGDWDN